MRTFDELEQAWATLPEAPRDVGTVRLICVRHASGDHLTPAWAEATLREGLAGDRWARRDPSKDPEGHAAVTLMHADVAALVADGQPMHTAGDNVYVDLDIGVANLPPGSLVAVGDAVLRVSEPPHTGCSTFSNRFGLDALRWVSTADGRARRLRGMNCSVERAGSIRVGDAITILSRGSVAAEPNEADAALA